MALSRRKLFRIAAGSGGAILAGGAVAGVVLDRKLNPHTPIVYPFPADAKLLPTPQCSDGLHPDATASVTEGPYYKPSTPERRVLREAGTVGTPLTLHGRVLTHDCHPIEGAVLDFWSCDGRGVYDNDGYHLRGHQYTDAAGAFALETVKPKDYKQFGIHRTAHIHVKVQGPGTALLTTQLYFPGEPLNAHDFFFKNELLLRDYRSEGGVLHGAFDFVLVPTA